MESLTGRGFSLFQRVVFGGYKGSGERGIWKMRSAIGSSLRSSFESLVAKKCAFTLAEVLITLVIIGVIAALTIPNLMQKYTEQTTVKKVQKFYSTLSNAFSLATKENGPASDWGIRATTESAEKIYNILFKPYFKIAKDCGVTNTGNCFANVTYKYINNNPQKNISSDTLYYKIALNDGATVWWRGGGSRGEIGSMFIGYDVNGHKEPNQWGKDAFQFTLIQEKLYPAGTPIMYGTSAATTRCRPQAAGESGIACAAWVIYKGNMDYLHCNDLSWNGKDKCK